MNGQIRHILALMMAAAVTAAACASTKRNDVPAPDDRVLLYNHGDMGSGFWRIPALATTNSGVVIAAADRRNDSNKDLPGNIDVAVRRSHDSGATWTEPQVAMLCDSTGGYGDAALGVHRPSGRVVMVAAHGNGIWESTPDDYTRVTVAWSDDDGLTWSAPEDITPMLYSPVEGVAPVKAMSAFASSGTMLCDDSGRLMFLLVARTGEKKWGPLEVFLCYSDDAGATWNINPHSIDRNGDEAKLAQLADGTYYASIRNRDKGWRRVSRSRDRGETWTAPVIESQLVDPACNGDLLALTPRQARALGIGGRAATDGLLIHSLANDPIERRNVSILVSADKGETWRRIFTVDPYPSGYSALTLLPDGTLGCLAEERACEGGFRLWFTKIKIKDIIPADL